MKEIINREIFKRWLFFPVLFVINSILNFYFTYRLETTHRGLLAISLISGAFLLISWILFYLMFNDLKKSAIMVFAASLPFFDFQNIVYQLRKIAHSTSNITLLRFWHSNAGQLICFGLMILFVIVVFLLVKKIEKINPLTILFLNVFSIIFLCTLIIRGNININHNKNEKENFINYWQNEIKNIDPSNTHARNNHPDIYYIILDGFTRSDVLLNLYDLDNSGFINELQKRGFFIASESYSNYTQTRSSLASSLNLRYLNEAADVIGEDKSYYFPAYYMIDNSIVENSLGAIGYDLVSFRSSMSYLDFKDWDYYFKPKSVPDSSTQTFISTTAMSVFLNPLLYRWNYEAVKFTIESLPSAGSIDGPQFIFAHILCPHPPFLFDSDGSLKKADRLYTTQDANYFFSSGTMDEYKNGYKDQVIFLQKSLIKMIDQINSTSTEPYILIMQGDHGSGMQLDQEDLSNTNINERFGILNAIYFFDRDYEELYEQISPVNTFRVIFTQYFGIDKPLLADRHYYSRYWHLFDFSPVDDLLD